MHFENTKIRCKNYESHNNNNQEKKTLPCSQQQQPRKKKPFLVLLKGHGAHFLHREEKKNNCKIVMLITCI